MVAALEEDLALVVGLALAAVDLVETQMMVVMEAPEVVEEAVVVGAVVEAEEDLVGQITTVGQEGLARVVEVSVETMEATAVALDQVASGVIVEVMAIMMVVMKTALEISAEVEEGVVDVAEAGEEVVVALVMVMQLVVVALEVIITTLMLMEKKLDLFMILILTGPLQLHMFHLSHLKLKKKFFTQLHKVSTLINMTTSQLKLLDLEN